MTRLHFAVLAHAHEPLVLNLLESLVELYPTSTASVFNGGSNPDYLADAKVAGRPVLLNPLSTQVRYGNMTPFHFGTFDWLQTAAIDFDYLVTLDHDVMALRAGLDEQLASYVGPMGYAGVRLREAPDPAAWGFGGSTIRLIHRHWNRTWVPLLDLPTPWWAFNPVQAFGRDLLDAIAAHPHLPAIRRKALASRVWAIEEVVIPSLAISVGAVAITLLGGAGINWWNCSARYVEELMADPDVCFVHRIPMRPDAPERRAVLAARLHGTVPAELLDAPVSPEPVTQLTPIWTRKRVNHAVQRRVDNWLAEHRG